MNTYGTPSYQTKASRPHGAIAVARCKAALAAAKLSAGNRRVSYLQSAIEHLRDLSLANARGSGLEHFEIELSVEIANFAFQSGLTAEAAEATIKALLGGAKPDPEREPESFLISVNVLRI